jgi:recombination protein RecT
MAQTTNQNQGKAPVKKESQGLNPIVNGVLEKVTKFQEYGELQLPSDYSPGNALKSAYLIISELKDKNNKPVIETCSKESIGKSLLDMVVQGLSPMKKQCAFVAYGGKLELIREYPGNIALARRFGGVKNVMPYVIYENDEVEFMINPETGKRSLIKHIEKKENRDINKIDGAYAYITYQDGSDHHVEWMTIDEIRKAWNQGYAKGQSPAHKNFPQEMAKKTVINRACKLYINSSDDGNVMDLPEKSQDFAKTSRDESINESKETISFDEHEEVTETRPEPTELNQEKKNEQYADREPKAEISHDEQQRMF